ncbi:MAG: hypothetical protein BMS9Abin20_0046 [Acidimicrobiia bacterium]|nr:MAG: hypothetical protein BMS9Abin20_0046 [Acidimicrobiia bacterium]
MFSRVIVAIGESDCENIGSGLLAQPVNTVSSLAFAVFGLVVLFSVPGTAGRERTARIGFGILMIGTGLGSVLFHGPQGFGSKFLHDVTFILAVLFIAASSLSGIRSWSAQLMWSVYGGFSLLVAVLLLIWPGSTNLLGGIAVLLLVVTDVLAHRARSVRMSWWVGALIAMAVAVAFYVGGRTGGPLCDSDALFQGHALWHVLSAAALWAYFEATAPARVHVDGASA